MLAGGLAYLGGLATAAHGQYAPPGGGNFGMPPAGMMGVPGGNGGKGGGAFVANPGLTGKPAEFPNPGIPSQEPVSPFSLRDDGAPNAFTELCDNRRPRSPSIVLRGDYLGWWVQRGPISTPLATTTSNFPTEIGALGEPNTVVLVPGNSTAIDYGYLSGIRLAAGIAPGFLPPIEVSGFWFNRNFNVFNGGSFNADGQYLARPIQLVDVAGGLGSGLNTVEFVNVPGFAAGQLDVISRLSFWSIDTNVFFNFADNGTIRMDLMLGYRHTELYEGLEINSRITGVNSNVNFGGGSFPTGFSTLAHDRFNAQNAFDGGQIGLRTILECSPQCKIFLDAKFALGVTNQWSVIDGVSTLYPNAEGSAATSLPGGIQALPSNIGVRSNREFSFIPEANLSFSYQWTQHLRVFGGYNILYWTNVVRPGDMIPGAVDSRQVPTDQNFISTSRPSVPGAPQFLQRQFFAHGFHVGVEIGF
jgi:hypothetical protein